MRNKIVVPEPSRYNVWPDRGLLPKPDPLDKLPDNYRPINNLAANIPRLLRTKKLREELDVFPVIDLAALKDGQEVECAMRSYSFFASAGIKATTYEETSERIPRGIAMPLYYLSERLERQPILSYDSYGPQNWKLLNKNGPIALGNIEVIQNFLGGKDENGFVLVHVEIEAVAGQALCNGPTTQKLALEGDPYGLNLALQKISLSIKRMNAALVRMPEFCRPKIYYNRVRPYIHGFKGVIYEGVEEYKDEPQTFIGETGAQSGIVPCLDAILGIEHADDPLSVYLAEMRKYMPKEHRSFIASLEKNKQVVREYILSHGQYAFLQDVYNECVQGLWEFRKQHLYYADQYIHRQIQTSASNPTSRGTGDTPFMQSLKKHVNETSKHLIIF